MFRCTDCGHLFEDGGERHWEENHGCEDGRGEPMSGCPLCSEPYEEVKPCAICGEYPGEKYDDGKLPNDGVCQGCFEDGIRERFDEYIESEGLAYEFYIGDIVTRGYAYGRDQIVVILRNEYAEFAKIFPKKAHEERTGFIMDGDPDHFVEWLINKKGEKDNAEQI